MNTSSWVSFTGAFSGTVIFDWAPEPALVAADADMAASLLENMSEPLHLARELAIADIEENFANEHGPDGEPWAPWSDNYVKYGNPGPSILTRSGAMRGVATARSSYPITAREVFFSMSEPEYWIWHQEGRVRRTRGMTHEDRSAIEEFTGQPIVGNVLPARPFAGIEEETQIAIVDVFDQWVGQCISVFIHSGGRAQARDPKTGRFTRLVG